MGDFKMAIFFCRWPLLTACVLVLACAKIDTVASRSEDASAAPAPGRDAALSPPVALPVADAGLDTGAPPSQPPGSCVNLQCQQVTCASGSTSLSGTAYAPNGTLPLYNVMVYVPNGPLTPFADGVTCDRCGSRASGQPIVSAISNEQGKFTLTNVPVGANIPLVFQIGKWRRRVSIPTVVACRENSISDPNLSRLPRNHSEGDIPRVAVATGGCDRLGCLLPKVGVDSSELGDATEGKRVAFYVGYGARPDDGPSKISQAEDLWDSEAELSKYDMALLSCDCGELTWNKGPGAWKAMTNYLAKGGRIFGTDFMYVWYKFSTDAQLSGAMSIQGQAPYADNPITIDTTFPKGKALADWMKVVDPTVTYGQFQSKEVFDNIVGAMPRTAQVWASSPVPRQPVSHPRIITINTPAGLPPDQQCGRAVHIDAHVFDSGTSANISPPPPLPFPASCGTTLNGAETALAFMLFDLAACIQDDSMPVVPPVVIP